MTWCTNIWNASRAIDHLQVRNCTEIKHVKTTGTCLPHIISDVAKHLNFHGSFICRKKNHVTLFAWRLGGSLLCWPGTSRHERKRKTTSKQRAHSSSRPAACSQNNDRAQYFIWRRFLKCFRSFRVELMTVTTVWLNDNVLFNQQMGTLPITHSTFWTVIYSLNHSQKSTEIKGDLINAIKMIDHAVMCMNYIILLEQMD